MTARGGRAGLIRWRGTPVTLTYETTANDESSDTVTVTQAAMTGYMLRNEGEAEQLRTPETTEQEGGLFEFVPVTAGDEPPIGARFVFGSDTFTLKERTPITIGGVVSTWRVRGVR